MRLSGLFAKILEIISGCLQVARYVIVILRLGIFFLGAICTPIASVTGNENRICSPGNILLNTMYCSGVSG